jgi:hypothetical protein
MNSTLIVFCVLTLVIILVFAYYHHYWNSASPTVSWMSGGPTAGGHMKRGGQHKHGGAQHKQQSSPLLKKLRDQGWVLYTKTGCHWCEKQLETLAEMGAPNFPHVADSGKFNSYPTWYNEDAGLAVPGYKDKNSLGDLLKNY